MSIVMEAARRLDEWKRIRRLVPSFKEIYQPTGHHAVDEDERDG